MRVLFKRFQLPLTPSPLPTIFLMAPMMMCGGSNRQLLDVSWLADCLEYVYQVVGEMI